MLDDKHYNWKVIEEEILKKIPDSTFYESSSNATKPYSIIMPPPNVTGYLHMGHSLVTTLQDTMARYKRMKGFKVLWQPGLDHAGIATQVVVQKQLKEKNLSKEDLGREKFIEKVYEWKENSGGKILEQIRRMGSSCDFSYTAFTMDEHSVNGVLSAFIQMYNDGLIYKDNRLVNWDCQLQTAISDLEVENREVKGHYYYLKYKLVDSQDYLIIATTRPETLFGDVAVAVNKEDERYKHLIGKRVIVPIINKQIPIIADDYADMQKGSGVVKITPAHDFNDFEVGIRNNLEPINILNTNGTLNENTPPQYQGLSIDKARKQILQKLEEQELIEKIESAIIMTPYGDRSNSVIQPLLTKQWFLDTTDLAKKALEVVQNGDIEFIPNNWKNLYDDWMKNIKPWCISRQLWWGHRIPAYYDNEGNIFVAKNLQEAQSQAFKLNGKNVELTQDEDVLDTWFSSSLWPFLTLGWPLNTQKLQTFYPTSLLITAFDIIFFWVARMIMMGVYFIKEVPFKKVYIHALIRDEKGQKMSKSKGNVIDPLDMIDKYGTDALRFALLAYCAHGRDIKLSEKNIEGYRNFVTKIWNSYKFAISQGAYFNPSYNPEKLELNLNKWILLKLQNLVQNVEKSFDSYRFADISTNIYQFIWGDFCDWYLELAKPTLYLDDSPQKIEIQETLGYVLSNIFKIIHPIMPFISQHLFENLHKKEDILAIQSYPSLDYKINEDSINTQNIINFISKIRSIRADYQIAPSMLLNIYVENKQEYLANNLDVICKVAKLNSITFVDKLNSNLLQDVIQSTIFGIELNNQVDFKAQSLRLNSSQKKLEQELNKILEKLNNQGFISKASIDVVQEYKDIEQNLQTQIKHISNLIAKISNF